jgi:hypothetical protein
MPDTPPNFVGLLAVAPSRAHQCEGCERDFDGLNASSGAKSAKKNVARAQRVQIQRRRISHALTPCVRAT